MKDILRAIIIAFLFLAGACAPLAEDRAALAEFAAADIKVALADATAHDDVIAAQCYAALLPALERWKAAPGSVGAVSAFQRARSYRRALADEALNAACAALVTDTGASVLRLARLVGLP